MISTHPAKFGCYVSFIIMPECVCMCVWVYQCRFRSVCEWLCVSDNVCGCVCVYLCVSFCVCVCVCLCVAVCVSLHMHICLCQGVHCMDPSLRMAENSCGSFEVRVHTHACTCMCDHEHEGAFVRPHLLLCVCVCVHVSARECQTLPAPIHRAIISERERK